MYNALDATSPWRNKPQQIRYQPLSPKEKALVERFFGRLIRKTS